MKPGDESVRRAGEGRTPLTSITLSIINYLSLATCFLSYYYYYYYLVFPVPLMFCAACSRRSSRMTACRLPISTRVLVSEKQTNSERLWINPALNHANACGEGFLVQLRVKQLRYVMQNC